MNFFQYLFYRKSSSRFSITAFPFINPDASTGVEDGPAAHLMRLVRASVRSAREHHSASVKLAPPTEGKYLDDSEKAIVDAYYRMCAVNGLIAWNLYLFLW